MTDKQSADDLTKSRRTTPPTLEEQTEAWQHVAKRDAKLLEALALSEAADRLRAAGWTVLPPPAEADTKPTTAKQKLAMQARGVKFGCHLELDDGQEPDGCVKDWGDEFGCIYASRHRTREGCKHWQPIKRPEERG